MNKSAGVIAILSLLLFGGLRSGAAENGTNHENGARLSPFGIGSCAKTGQDLTKWLPQMSEIGIQVLRTCRMRWKDVEPEDGKYDWAKLDEQLSFVAANKMEAGGMIMGWDSKEHKTSFPLYNLAGWTRYVTEVVKHTKGRVKYFAVWNEPPNGTQNAPASDYAKVMIATYDAAKAANPDCLVGISAKSVDLNYLSQAIQAGAKGHFDYISLHPYETLGCATTRVGTEPVFMGIVPTVRKMLADLDPAKENCPVWFTEIGCNTKKGEEHQAHVLVKAYTMSIAQGVACINWFSGMDGDSGPMGLLRADGSKRPDYAALAQMIQHLGSYPAYLGWVLLNDKDCGFVFQGAKGPVLITWAPKGTTDKVDFGQAVQIVDPLAGTAVTGSACELTEAPVIVPAAPAKIVAQAQANKSKPFPWGGDYSGAKSVSITLGGKPTEKGLHTQAGDSIAADVIAYGGGATRAGGEIPGGNVFMVDPNFLSYSATPIQISAVVRRNEANDPAKVGLEYESTKGMTKTEPCDIPDNKEWHTASWTINDAQFVSKYGFNFRLDPGKYFIQSVTVTKLDKKNP